MGTKFEPFANESDAVGIGELNVENRVDRVSIFGSVDITCDKEGLANIRILKEIVDATAKALAQRELPDKVKVKPPGKVDNPFA
ncbi:MAG TPA: hypothetical protein VGK27_00670 [Candidatus Deferrimicrobiaceae bacterium]|jgi:hypothetical protein